MSKPAVIIDYEREPDKALDNFAQGVYDSLNPNPNFIWEVTVMPLFLTGITNYRSKLEISQNGSAKDTTAKNVAKAVLAEQLRMIAMEVNKQADGDLTKLQSTGLRLAKERSKIGVLPKPTGFKVTSGNNSGDLLCTVDANSDADVYHFYSASVPTPADIIDWRLTTSSTRKKNISGFTPGKQYELKCAYKGSEDQLIFSDSVLIYAQ